jgi:hypothetical protein
MKSERNTDRIDRVLGTSRKTRVYVRSILTSAVGNLILRTILGAGADRSHSLGEDLDAPFFSSGHTDGKGYTPVGPLR